MSGHYFFEPDWPVSPNVKSFISFQPEGSDMGYGGFNLATHVGDELVAVRQNRQRLYDYLKCDEGDVFWLNQVHSDLVLSLPFEGNVDADGVYCDKVGVPCVVLTADCLPILVCDKAGGQVAALHGGWRGLVNGIIERGVALFSGARQDLMVYLGPAICQGCYAVGDELVQAVSGFSDAEKRLFLRRVDGQDYFSLVEFARVCLKRLGVVDIYGGMDCTFEDRRFYSYRRDAVTGRFLSGVVIQNEVER